MTRVLRGVTWDHPRGFDPLAKGVPLFTAKHPDYEIEWTRRSLRDFGVQPVETLADARQDDRQQGQGGDHGDDRDHQAAEADRADERDRNDDHRQQADAYREAAHRDRVTKISR